MRHKNQISLKVESSVSGEQKDHFESCKFGFVTSDVWIRIDGSTETQNSNREKWNLTSKKVSSFYEKLHEKDNNNEKRNFLGNIFVYYLHYYSRFTWLKYTNFKFVIHWCKSQTKETISPPWSQTHRKLSSPTKLLMLM